MTCIAFAHDLFHAPQTVWLCRFILFCAPLADAVCVTWLCTMWSKSFWRTHCSLSMEISTDKAIWAPHFNKLFTVQEFSLVCQQTAPGVHFSPVCNMPNPLFRALWSEAFTPILSHIPCSLESKSPWKQLQGSSKSTPFSSRTELTSYLLKK